MKNIIRILVLLVITSEWTMAQSPQENLQKYWRYRQRLRDKFMIVSPNVEEPGVNIPAIQIDLINSIIDWGDGNENLSHYLSILTTEYRLLKNNGQDYKQTLTELIYAMCAIERLDVYSESYERNGTFYSSDINGFFIRDDINQTFFDKYKNVL